MEKGEFGALRDDVESTQTETRQADQLERASRENPTLGWDYYDSPTTNYEATFREVFPAKVESFSQYLHQYYGYKIGQLIGVEIGGPAIKLFSGLNRESTFKHTAGFTLNAPKNTSDHPGNHEVVEADVFNTRRSEEKIKGYQNIRKWVDKNGRVDILIERMVRGIQKPDNIVIQALKRWYQLLSEDGTAFAELPRQFSSTRMIEQYLKQHQDLFDYQIHTRERDLDYIGGSLGGTFLRLRKLPGAPDSLNELLKE